jgi:hypothetical protein
LVRIEDFAADDGAARGSVARQGSIDDEPSLNWDVPFSTRDPQGSIEFIVVLLGWLLGGTLGFGTIIFAVCIGPFVALSLKIVPLLKN